jgi:outer membrane lipopolysaccharide assembly protein LptE/RlpB
LALAAVVALSGCGYQANGSDPSPTSNYQWRSLYREDVHSIAVPIFTNRDFHQGVEFSLTKALINDIESHTPYKIEPRERADTILEGEIETVKASTLSLSSVTATPQEQVLTITVNFTWKKVTTGQILVSRKEFQQASTYYPTSGEAQSIGSQQAVEQLALAITHELEAPW